MTWDESKVTRDDAGRFTEAGVRSWAARAVRQIERRAAERGQRLYRPGEAVHVSGERPAGYAEAADRLDALWGVASTRERTDAEQDELERLEAAFEAYAEETGHGGRDVASWDEGLRNPRKLPDYDRLGRPLPLASLVPGRVGEVRKWSNRYSRSQRHKSDVQSRRIEDGIGAPGDRERRLAEDGGKIGYREQTSEWVTAQKRRKARARAERAGHDVWLLAVNGEIERRRGRSGT